MNTGIRYAVYDTLNNEILAANFLSPGAANNCATLDFYESHGIVTVKTDNDKILGQCDRRGKILQNQRHKFLSDIWEDVRLRHAAKAASHA